MPKWLDDIRALKGKIYKKKIANNSKFYIDCLKNLVDEYSDIYHRSTEKFNKLNTKVISLENEIHDTTTLIYINQYNTDRKSLEKKQQMLIKKVHDISDLVTTTVLNTKIGKVENKILDFSGLVKETR